MNSVSSSILSINELNNFFKKFNFKQDSKHIQEYISFIKEASFYHQNIIHKFYDTKDNKLIGFVVLSTTKAVDNITGILIEFIYLKSEYRGMIDKIHQTKYSYLILDYVIEVAIKIQKEIAINHIYLVPINDKVRTIYQKYGFENIPHSGNNKFEDYMVFNLLEEDFTIE